MMISLSAGKRSPRLCAFGISTARPDALRMRRRRSVFCPSRAERRARVSPRRLAKPTADVCRATTQASVPRKKKSQRTSQWRPLAGTSFPEDAELGAAGAGVVGDLRRGRGDWLPRIPRPQSVASTGTHGLAGRTNAGAGPFPEEVLDHPVLTGVIGDHREDAFRDQAIEHHAERFLELFELPVHRHPD